MRKINYIPLLVLASFFVSGCEKETESFDISQYKGQKFLVNVEGFYSANDTKLLINSDWNKILFSNNDIVYIDNIPFKLTHSKSDNNWYATRNDGSSDSVGVDLTTHSCVYYGQYITRGESSFNAFNLTTEENSPIKNTEANLGVYANTLKYHRSSIFMGGITQDSVLTLRPACALIRIVQDGGTTPVEDYEQFSIGFVGSDKPLHKGTVSLSADYSPTFTDIASMAIVEKAYVKKKYYMRGDMLIATNEFANDGGYYVAVPLNGSSISVDLLCEYYIGYEGSLTDDDFLYKRINGVTLSPGAVYTINIAW